MTWSDSKKLDAAPSRGYSPALPGSGLRMNYSSETARDMIDFQTHPERYRHWRLEVDGPIATLTMDVDERAGLFEGYELKLNSYDLGVDIELHDAVQRLRF